MDAERREGSAGQALLFAQQAEQEMLGTDVVVPQRTRFFLREDDTLASTLGEALEQASIVRSARRL